MKQDIMKECAGYLQRNWELKTLLLDSALPSCFVKFCSIHITFCKNVLP